MDKGLFFPIVGLESFSITDEKTGMPCILFKSADSQFQTLLRWNIDRLNDFSFWQYHAEKIKTLLHNRIKFEDTIYETEDEIIDFINKNYPDYSPQNKLDNLLEYFHDRSSFDGEEKTFYLIDNLENPQLWRKFYFKNANEFVFYLRNLGDQGLVKWSGVTNGNYHHLGLTLKGLTKVIQVKETKNSTYCFIAMSFSKELETIFENAIVPAIKQTGFEPLIIRKEHIDSDKTITDAIIAAIKKSRFTIADFTEHKAGVYFEAGYALGRGQKVIYTCRKDNIDKAHFDTRNLQHIIWDDENELKAMLIDKIEAYILD